MRLKILGMFVLVVTVLGVAIMPTMTEAAGPPVFTELYYNGDVVRTVVPPAAMPKPGTENFYAIPDQRPVVETAPGDKKYRGGKWAFHSVMWIATPYLLTSEDMVLMAKMAGDITVTRVEEMDFKCPVQFL